MNRFSDLSEMTVAWPRALKGARGSRFSEPRRRVFWPSGLATALHVNSSETFQILAVRFRPHAFICPNKSAVGVWQALPETA